MRQGVVFQWFGECVLGREVIYNSFLKFQMRHDWFSFLDLRQSDEGADTDLKCNFLLLYYFLCQKTLLLIEGQLLLPYILTVPQTLIVICKHFLTITTCLP